MSKNILAGIVFYFLIFTAIGAALGLVAWFNNGWWLLLVPFIFTAWAFKRGLTVGEILGIYVIVGVCGSVAVLVLLSCLGLL